VNAAKFAYDLRNDVIASFKTYFFGVKIRPSLAYILKNAICATRIIESDVLLSSAIFFHAFRQLSTLFVKQRSVVAWRRVLFLRPDRRVCRLCLFVCPLQRISKTTVQTSRNFMYVLIRAMAYFFFVDNGIRYVLPVLWMTSLFRIMGHVACDIVIICVSAMLEQVVINFKRIPQVAPD